MSMVFSAHVADDGEGAPSPGLPFEGRAAMAERTGPSGPVTMNRRQMALGPLSGIRFQDRNALLPERTDTLHAVQDVMRSDTKRLPPVLLPDREALRDLGASVRAVAGPAEASSLRRAGGGPPGGLIPVVEETSSPFRDAERPIGITPGTGRPCAPPSLPAP